MYRLHGRDRPELADASRWRFFLQRLQFLRSSRAVFTKRSDDAMLPRMSTSLPVIDLRLAANGADARAALARELDFACSEFGFFYLVGHEVATRLSDGLLTLAREFFASEQAEKMQIHMSRGGRAWRGYFPV